MHHQSKRYLWPSLPIFWPESEPVPRNLCGTRVFFKLRAKWDLQLQLLLCCAHGFPVLNTEGPLCDCKFDESNPNRAIWRGESAECYQCFWKGELVRRENSNAHGISGHAAICGQQCADQNYFGCSCTPQNALLQVLRRAPGMSKRQAEGRSSSLFEQNAPLHLLQHYLFRICLFHSGAPR